MPSNSAWTFPERVDEMIRSSAPKKIRARTIHANHWRQSYGKATMRLSVSYHKLCTWCSDTSSLLQLNHRNERLRACTTLDCLSSNCFRRAKFSQRRRAWRSCRAKMEDNVWKPNVMLSSMASGQSVEL